MVRSVYLNASTILASSNHSQVPCLLGVVAETTDAGRGLLGHGSTEQRHKIRGSMEPDATTPTGHGVHPDLEYIPTEPVIEIARKFRVAETNL